MKKVPFFKVKKEKPLQQETETEYKVLVPEGVLPGEQFQTLAGTRIVLVRCPPNGRPGQALTITVPKEEDGARPPSRLQSQPTPPSPSRNNEKRIEAKKNIDDELLDIDRKVGDAKRRQASLILQRARLEGIPDTWCDTADTIVNVPPEDEQYWIVLDRMRESMDDVQISKLWRVQNISLWSYYCFRKDCLLTGGSDHGERTVFHGTSSLDPSVIYNDNMDGFTMKFASKGKFGKGLYFADKAAYSAHCAFKPSQASEFTSDSDTRPEGTGDEREMFLARLLVGNEISLDGDESSASEFRNLTVPLSGERAGVKYNTVTGNSSGSQVWVVYENGRAYPDYLVRYYRGDRDPERSPYASKADIRATWEFLDNSGWKPYIPAQQAIIESHYKDFLNEKTALSTVKIKGDVWDYKVDVVLFTQTNTDHPGHRQRDVRRRVV